MIIRLSFDIAGISQLGSEIFDSQLFIALNHIMGNITRIGKREKGYFDRNEKDWWDIIRCLVVVDECHNILNIEKAYAAKWFVTLMSEARKYFTGIALATQRVQRMFPNADNAQDKDTVEAANKLKRNIWFDSIQNSLKTRFYFNWLLKNLWEYIYRNRIQPYSCL